MFRLDNIEGGLLRRIRRYDQYDFVRKLIGLSLLPEYQANHLRILTMIHVALVHANGSRKPTLRDMSDNLNELLNHESGQNEDPIEDVFVSAIPTVHGNFRILNGLYPAADFALARLIEVAMYVEFDDKDALMRPAFAMLAISEAIVGRCGYQNHACDPGVPRRTDWNISLQKVQKLGRCAEFTWAELEEIGVSPGDILPFLKNKTDDLTDNVYGYSGLSRYPVLANELGVFVPIPSAISGAIRLYLVHAIARGEIPERVGTKFHEFLMSRWAAYDLHISGAKKLIVADYELPEPRLAVPASIQLLAKIDENKVAHIIIIEADWTSPPEHSINQSASASLYQSIALSSFIAQSQEVLQARYGFSGGLTVVVYDSPGWGTQQEFPKDDLDNWYCVGCTSYSLAALMADPEFDFLALWKMRRDQNALRGEGIQLSTWPDVLNHWSIWHGLGGTFWPPTLDLKMFGMMIADTSKIIEVVERGRESRKVHAALMPTGEWLRVETRTQIDSPMSELDKPIFFDPISLVLGELRGVVESEYGSWWLVMGRPPTDAEERRFLYLLWEGAKEWLFRIARSASRRFREFNHSLEIRLLPVPESIKDAPDEVEFVETKGVSIITVVLPYSFVAGLIRADNAGEAVLVFSLLKSLSILTKNSLSDHELERWVAELMAEQSLKMLHITGRGDAGFAVDLETDRIPARLLQESDLMSAGRGVYAELLQAGAVSVGIQESISETDDIIHALNGAVDVHWARCRKLLADLDKFSTLELALQQIEGIHRDRVEAERAAAARVAYFSDSPDYEIWAKLRIGRRDAAFQSYRVLAEMALCEAKESGGRLPGLSDIDAIAANISHLISAAHNSDRVKRSLDTLKISFNPDGSIVTRSENAESGLFNYHLASLGESIAKDIDAYPSLFTSYEDVDDDDESGADFQSAFRSEFGLSLEDAFKCVRYFGDIAWEEKAIVARVRLSAFVNRSEREGMAAEVAHSFVRAFGLLPRDAWDGKPSEPFRMDDIYPWFFERRLSIMLRPVLVVHDAGEPVLMFGVRQLMMGIQYASILLETGVWPKNKLLSDDARRFVDITINRRGLLFEREVTQLAASAGWQVFGGIPMRRLGAPAKMGDLDVLAVSADGTVWVVIECKWFGAARTPREVAGWMQDFHGHDGDKLHKHLQRFEWVSQNTGAVAKALGIQSLPMKVCQRIATTEPVPLPFVGKVHEKASVWTRREIVRGLRKLSGE